MSETQQPLSFGEAIPRAQRQANYRRVRFDGTDSRESVLSIEVPEVWKEIPQEPSQRPGWVGLKSFAPSATAGVDVFRARQQYEVDLNDWIQFQAELLSLTITASERVATEYGDVIQASAKSAQGDRFRLVLAGDGPNLFLLSAHAGPAAPPAADDVLGLIAGSLLFRKHSGRLTREEMMYVDVAEQEFRLIYPKSWKFERRPDDVSAADFRVARSGETLAYARMLYDVDQPKGPEGLRRSFDAAVEEAKQAGVQVDSMDRLPATGGGSVERVLARVRLSGKEGQMFFAFRSGQAGWLRCSTLTPAKSVNPMVWMRAKRFDEIVCLSLQRSGLAGS